MGFKTFENLFFWIKWAIKWASSSFRLLHPPDTFPEDIESGQENVGFPTVLAFLPCACEGTKPLSFFDHKTILQSLVWFSSPPKGIGTMEGNCWRSDSTKTWKTCKRALAQGMSSCSFVSCPGSEMSHVGRSAWTNLDQPCKAHLYGQTNYHGLRRNKSYPSFHITQTAKRLKVYFLFVALCHKLLRHPRISKSLSTAQMLPGPWSFMSLKFQLSLWILRFFPGFLGTQIVSANGCLRQCGASLHCNTRRTTWKCYFLLFWWIHRNFFSS